MTTPKPAPAPEPKQGCSCPMTPPPFPRRAHSKSCPERPDRLTVDGEPKQGSEEPIDWVAARADAEMIVEGGSGYERNVARAYLSLRAENEELREYIRRREKSGRWGEERAALRAELAAARKMAPLRSMSVERLVSELAAAREEIANLRTEMSKLPQSETVAARYPTNSMCASGHQMVLWMDEDFERCPVCRAEARVKRLAGIMEARGIHEECGEVKSGTGVVLCNCAHANAKEGEKR